MKVWESAAHFASAANAAIPNQTIDVSDCESVVVLMRQGAGGVATGSVGAADPTTMVSLGAVYQAAFAIPVGIDGVAAVFGPSTEYDNSGVNVRSFGPPPALLTVASIAGGAGVSVVIDVWVQKQVDA